MTNEKSRSDISRRSFLDRAGKFAVGGLAAGTILDPRAAMGQPAANSSQTARRRPQRVAVVGVDHYHATYPPNYLRILRNEGVDIVGVHAPEAAIATRWAGEYGSTPYTDYREMVERTNPEFVIACGKHVDMPEYFRYLVDAGVPFLMEKPWGVDDATVNELADLAESRGAWVAVPMPFRYDWFAETAVAMRRSGELGTISHGLLRFNQPGVQRYRDMGSSWMLSEAQAGGGALVNLGIHGFDLCRYVTGEEPSVVSAVTSRAIHRTEIEDYALVTLRTPSGIIFVNEVGYTMFPGGSDSDRKFSGEKAFLRAVGGGVQIIGPDDRNETIPTPEGYLGGWPRVVNECLNRLGNGEPPPATARDCARAVSLVFDAYRAAGQV